MSAVAFDAIVLDLVMPQVDGWQFRLTQLRHPELAGIPTVIVTVRPLREPDLYALRAADVIQKPFRDSVHVEAVANACRTPQLGVSTPVPEPDQLFWSRRGEVACWSHAPRNDSLRWHQEQWTAIPETAAQRRIRALSSAPSAVELIPMRARHHHAQSHGLRMHIAAIWRCETCGIEQRRAT